MSRENEALRIVRDGYDAFNRGDVEAAASALDPAVEWWPAADEPVVEPYRGHDGYRRLVAEVREGVADLQVEIEELFAAGGWVFACVRFWGRGRASGVPVEIRETHVARVRDGLIVEVREFREKSAALEAFGTSDPASPR